ncbi:YXWGXW repeat-containing protein [Paraburkholderia dioscoreae]|uniref:Putative lipoprotein n=1 Tax=Paraburkholderia dioscoreae TaxID=2604047 RepID=A0A5Q4ZLP8_9BURK|nr:YXWGXW repeat-containing protein [Paraburkholderia dioscoreae]VVD32746.1 putative lipoprotein [Paraburkholderia dioscoreae]
MTFTKPVRLLTSTLAVALTCAAATLTAAPAFAQAVIVAPMAPPPSRVEVVPAPRVGYVWDQGRWHWDQGHYVWVGGHWMPMRAGYHWVPGHWMQIGPNWRWIDGHWA